MKDYITAKELAELTGRSRATAYNILHAVNDELRAKGYLVISGQAPTGYVRKRLGLPAIPPDFKAK